MNFEQIMIRLGVDATAVKTGLGKVGSLVKGWGVSIAQSLKGQFGAMLGAGAVIAGLNAIKTKIMEIAHAAEATGASTDFIQGMMQIAEKGGHSFEKMSMGIIRFNKTLGAGKMGDPKAIVALHDMGVITGKTTAKTVDFASAIHNLAIKYDSLNDKQKQAALLSSAFGRGYAEMIPIFEHGAAAVDKMGQGSFFTKISSTSITDFKTMWSSVKTGSIVAMAVVANAIGSVFHGFGEIGKVWGVILGGGAKSFTRNMTELEEQEEKQTAQKRLQSAADADGISLGEKKVKILQEEKDAKEKILELSAQINERDKMSVSDMAGRVRKIMGIKGPLDNMRTITPRMMTSFNIETLEDRAKVAFLNNDDALSNKLQGEADQIRKANTWLKRSDIDPMKKANDELVKVNEQLEYISSVVDLVHQSE